jgi:chlorobactene glucosyltransferase
MELFQIILFSVLAVLTAGCAVNLAVFPRVRAARGGEPRRAGPGRALVSVLVPARDEEANIGACLDSLLAQDDPNHEILVLDDRSRDATPDLIRARGFAAAAENPEARLRHLAGSELPEGWAGKPWACHQLALAARGEWLLFTDADTLHAPDCVRLALETAMRHRATLLSAWPRQVLGSFAEKLVLPLLYVLTHVLLPQALVAAILRWPWLARVSGRRATSALGAANGQFILIRRDAYDTLGGHAAVRADLVEDVALGRLVMGRAADGWRLVNADGGAVVRCRMYRNFAEVWAGFSKNLRPVFGRSTAAFVASGLVQWTLFVQPFVFALLPLPGQAWAAGQAGLLLAMRALLAWRFRTGWTGVWLHAPAYLLALAIALNSWRWSRRGAIRWKGRTYDPQGRRPSGAGAEPKPR